MGTLPRNLVVAFVSLGILLLGTFLYIRAGQPYERLPYLITCSFLWF